MSRVRETDPGKLASTNTEGAGRAAFTVRLQTILLHWPSTDRLARATGVSPSAFRKWLRGEAEPSRERLIALADAAKVGIAWLAKGEGPAPAFARTEEAGGRQRASETAGGVDPSRFLLLPKEAECAAAGAGEPSAPRTDIEYIAFRHDWVRTALRIDPTDLIMEIAVGESMQPTIRDGDLLLVDTTAHQISNFGVYVLEVCGERLVKRVQRKLDGTLVLLSDNPIYETDQVTGEMLKDVVVVGRVVWAGGAI